MTPNQTPKFYHRVRVKNRSDTFIVYLLRKDLITRKLKT